MLATEHPAKKAKKTKQKQKKKKKKKSAPALDAQGRVAGTSDIGLDFSFQTHHGLLHGPSPRWSARLEADCRTCFLQRSFWLPSNAAPRCALEEIARRVFEQHTRGVAYDHRCSGAEWWTQVRGPEERHAPARSGQTTRAHPF